MLLTISSAGDVLDLFTPGAPERGVTEVALELGVSKSKAHALLASLTQVGLLRRTDAGRYRLGWRVLTLGRVLDETTDFAREARPIMEALADRLGERVNLGALYDGQIVCVDRVEGERSVRVPGTGAGAMMPAHCSAIGKTLLCELSVAALDQLTAQHGLPAWTARTITDRAQLDAELAAVRMRGYAFEREEGLVGLSCVAAPIVAPGPRVVAAISIAAPSERFERRSDTYRRAVVLAAQHISRRLRESRRESAHELCPTSVMTAAAV